MSKTILRGLLAFLFIGAGIVHFVRPGPFVEIVPPWLPHPLALVYLSGFFEIVGGIGLGVARTRRWAGYGLMALLVAVFPANLYMLTDHPHVDGMAIPPLLLWLRLPLQGVLLAAVWWVLRDEPIKKGTP